MTTNPFDIERALRGDDGAVSDALYEPGETTNCMCTKCGWVGESAAPHFVCGGCGKYVAAPLDRDKRRRKAAEAEVARLKARVDVLEREVVDLKDDMTAWKHIAEANIVLADGRVTDMRERAAKLVENCCDYSVSHIASDTPKFIAAAIRALPIEETSND